MSGLSHKSNNNNQYHLLFLSLSHRCPTIPTVHAGAHTSSRTHSTPICEYHYSNRGRLNNIRSWRYYCTSVCLLICTENAYHTNTRWHRQEERLFFLGEQIQEIPPQIQKVSPHRFKRWPPPRVWCGTFLRVALCYVWGIDSRGGSHRFKRWLLPRV